MAYIEYNGKRFDVKNNRLNLQGQGITDIIEIKGLNNLPNLISINLSDNKIEKIKGLDNLIHLESLYLDKNQIAEIEGLDNLLNLKWLALGGNKISEIKNISHLKKLNNLFLHGNKLNKIKELDYFTNLKRLNLSYNKIRTIEGLDNLENLYTLSLRNNRIRSIESLENLVKLKRLDLLGNKISEIKGLNNLIELEHLDLTFNRINEIEGLQNLPNLRLLNLSHNYIIEIKGLEGLNISTLDLSNNRIKEIKGLNKLPNLIHLDIKNNPIIDREEFLLYRDVNTIKDFCRDKNQLIKGIIGDGEDETTEYKESFRYDVKQKITRKDLKNEVTKSICAFLNKYSGELFIGVNNSGEIKGIEGDLNTYGKKIERSDKKDKFLIDISNKIREELGTKVINKIKVDFIPISNEEIVKVSVNRSMEPVFTQDNKFYVRIGSASVELNNKDTFNYIQGHFGYKKSLDDEDLEDELSKFTTKPKIDLALRYIDNFNKKKITYKKHKSRIQFICSQFRMLSNLSMIDEDSIDSCLKFIMFAMDVIEFYNDNMILGRIYEVFLSFSSQKLTIEVLKEHTYEILSGSFNQGDRDTDLICILVNLGFFDKIILTEIDKAVQNNDLDFIKSLYYADLSRFNDYGNILDYLTLIIEHLDSTSDKNLINPIENLINKFEKLE